MIVAIDGPAGSGKSSVARALAQRCELAYLDTGAMYRAVTLCCIDAHIIPDDTLLVCNMAKNLDIHFERTDNTQLVYVGTNDVTSKIRTERVDAAVSEFSAIPELREILVAKQQAYGANADLVAEGRDIATVVFPHAELKIFLTASPEARAKRRSAERAGHNLAKETDVEIDPKAQEYILSEIKRRDAFDSSREASPLRPAKDAHIIDTSDMSFDEVLNLIISYSPHLVSRDKERQ